MVNDTSQKGLLAELQELVQAHRRAFKQERPYWRAMGLVLGEVFNFGRHTVTQDLLTLGMIEGTGADGTGYSHARDLTKSS